MRNKKPPVVRIFAKENILGLNRGEKMILLPKGEYTWVNPKAEGWLWNRFRRWILKRDNYTCKKCGTIKRIGLILQVHHIIPIYKNPELMYDEKNCETICLDCHKKTESFGSKAKVKEMKINLDKYDVADATHNLEGVQFTGSCYIRYNLPCIILKNMPYDKLKIIVFGERRNMNYQKKRITYVDSEAVSEKVNHV